MSFDITVRDRIASSIEQKLQRIELQAESTTRAINRMRQSLRLTSASTGISGQSNDLVALSTNAGRANKQVTSLGQSINRSLNTTRRLVTGAYLIQSVDNAADSLDSYQQLQNRLRGVSNVFDSTGAKDAIASQERLNEVTNEMFGIAQRARVPIGSLAKTYRRLDNALAEMGISQKETLDITETMSKILGLSGANAGEAGAAMLQLSQAFSKGKLDGDEFRSVAELMPSLIKAISDELGIAKGEIFKYSKEGKISLGVMLNAFRSLKDTVARDFADLPRTIGHAFTQLSNEVTRFFGQSERGNSFIQTIIAGLDYIRNNLPTVVKLLESLAVVLGSQAIAGFVSNFGSLQGILFNVSQLIPLVLGYFTFFSDEIKVTSDGVVTLRDLVKSLIQTIGDLVSKGEGFLGAIFSVEGAQFAFDVISGFLNNVLEVTKSIIAAGKTLFGVVQNLSFDQVIAIMGEGMLLLGNKIYQWGLEIAIVLGEAGTTAGRAFVDAILMQLERFFFIASKFSKQMPVSNTRNRQSSWWICR